MSGYAPTSRRPIAGAFRKLGHGAASFCVRRGISPDAISYAGLIAAAGAGACLLLTGRWPVLLLAAPVLMGARLYCNMLDGTVALESGKASRRGEIINELPDRISDILIFAGIVHSGLASAAIAYWAALLAVLTAYIGTLGQAVAGRRRFEGIMSKQWRMVTLGAGCIAMYAAIALGWRWRFAGLSILDWLNLLIIAGCVQTCYVRLRHTLRDLRCHGEPH